MNFKVGDLVVAPKSRNSGCFRDKEGILDRKARVVDVDERSKTYKVRILDTNNACYSSYIVRDSNLIPFVEGWEGRETRDAELAKLAADYSMRISEAKVALERLESTLDALVAAQQELRGSV